MIADEDLADLFDDKPEPKGRFVKTDDDLADLFDDGDTSGAKPQEDLADLFDDVAAAADPPGEAGPSSLDTLAATLPEHWRVAVRAVMEALAVDRDAT